MTYSIGDNLSDLTAASTAGEFRMRERAGRWVVLYFYPKDNTSACTLEARDFSAAVDEFAALSADVVGISRDSLKVHAGFCTRQDLKIELISDAQEQLCTAFDVIKLKTMYGKQCRGIVRSTFLIDPQGVLVKQWRAVKVPGHVQAVLDELRARQSA